MFSFLPRVGIALCRVLVLVTRDRVRRTARLSLADGYVKAFFDFCRAFGQRGNETRCSKVNPVCLVQQTRGGFARAWLPAFATGRRPVYACTSPAALMPQLNWFDIFSFSFWFRLTACTRTRTVEMERSSGCRDPVPWTFAFTFTCSPPG